MSKRHLSDHSHPPHPAKKHSRILPRSLHKLLRSIFRPKHDNNSVSMERAFYVYDTSTALFTIPEVPETLPEMKSLITRTDLLCEKGARARVAALSESTQPEVKSFTGSSDSTSKQTLDGSAAITEDLIFHVLCYVFFNGDFPPGVAGAAAATNCNAECDHCLELMTPSSMLSGRISNVC
ncbi:hypothetical protein SSX86_023499 [Deinandra increscens subsp. villosa]|uniref:Uncharacterized protein n=1 Tax=Deinandra increscens subsp. villosa TaxID=3103831 RepID=A0AAP0CR59_9ASTR